MVFHCRCFSFEEYVYESRPKSASAQTFYSASSDFHPDSQAKASVFSNLPKKTTNLRVFTLAELKSATKNFCRDSKIGKGGVGIVYRGVIKSLEHPFDEILVAVKFANGELQVGGTMVYAAPEYIKTGQLTSKSDVWSYGVFLFELITGRHPLDRSRPANEQDLLEWVAPYLDSKKFHQIIDPRLQGNYLLESVQKLSFIANKCLTIDPKCRPKMSEVLEMVNQLITGVPSQAAVNPAPPLKSLTPVVAIEPKHAFADSILQGKKTTENMNSVDKRGSTDTACLPRI